MASLSSREVWSRGAHVSMVYVDGTECPDMIAFMRVDKDRRYIIATSSSSFSGAPWTRVCWREEEGDAQRVPLSVPQPEVAEVYFGYCAPIDRHNRCGQDDLQLERKLGTDDLSMRVNVTMLGICIMDAWLLCREARGAAAVVSQAAFYEVLASCLIDYDFNFRALRTRASGATAAEPQETTPSGVGIHLVHTFKRRRGSTHLAQRNCRICQTGRSTLVRSACQAVEADVYLCGSRTGGSCWSTPLRDTHQFDL